MNIKENIKLSSIIYYLEWSLLLSFSMNKDPLELNIIM